MERRKTTILNIAKKKTQGKPITMLTAYDYSSGLLVDEAGIDLILVGDSLGMVMLGLESTVPVTMEEMLHHCRAVGRGAKYAYLVGDMPFMSYQASIPEAIKNAGRFLKEGMMDAVKLEGGSETGTTVRSIVNAGIPVMGHIGLTPQSASKLGGYRVQGRTSENASRLLEDALVLEDSGCFSVVIEAVPAPVAEQISNRLTIPTIGIGAGPDCDGQVLVYHDVVGLFDRFTPSFVKQYANVGQIVHDAISAFAQEVRDGGFPTDAHTYAIDDDELEAFYRTIKQEPDG